MNDRDLHAHGEEEMEFQEISGSESRAPEYMENALQRLREGKMLDAICAGGRRGGTSFLPTNAAIDSETEKNLQVTARIIPSGIEKKHRDKELRDPSSIPVLGYNPQTSRHFWNWVNQYAIEHAEDTAARIFGMVNSGDVQSFIDSQADQLGANPQLEDYHRLDIPLFVLLQSRKHIRDVLSKINNGVVQGVILQDANSQLPKFAERWQEYLAKQAYPDLIPRPFIGLQGDTNAHLSFMASHKATDQIVDTLVFSDTPTAEQAKKIRDLHLARMRKVKTATRLNNPFAIKDDKREKGSLPTTKIGVINVQGGARADAIALMRASKHAGVDIAVSLIENEDQYMHEDPDAIVLPGGWHGLQFRLQETLGLNKLIIEQVVKERRKDLLALCAGAIQGRTADNASDAVQNAGCQIGTALGIGKYKVVNNAYNTPRNLIIATHSTERRGDKARIYPQIPLSNAPYIHGEDPEAVDVIARISTTPFAEQIADDDGAAMGIQVRQASERAHIRMAFAFHHESAFLLFLHEMQIRILACIQHKQMQSVREHFQTTELEADI